MKTNQRNKLFTKANKSRMKHLYKWICGQDQERAVNLLNWFSPDKTCGCFIGEYILANPRIGLKKDDGMKGYTGGAFPAYNNRGGYPAVGEYLGITVEASNYLFSPDRYPRNKIPFKKLKKRLEEFDFLNPKNQEGV